MTDFVCGFLRETLSNRILMVRKRKPSWQAGLLNGPGGKIEMVQAADCQPGMPPVCARAETPLEAMIREWNEEIGFDHTDWRQVVVMNDPRDIYANGGNVHWFAGEVRMFPSHNDINDSGEPVETVRLHDIPMRRDVVATVLWIPFKAFCDPTAPLMVSAPEASN